MTVEAALTAGEATREEAWRLFDAGEPIDPSWMVGTWRGAELRTGHPMDGLLEAFGWYGKQVIDPERVHPLLFFTADRTGAFAVDPAKLPVWIPLHVPLPRLPGALYHQLLLGARPLLETRQYKARLHVVEFRGRASATMTYHDQPIHDVFRLVAPDTLLGVMNVEGDARPYFFVLRRDETMPLA